MIKTLSLTALALVVLWGATFLTPPLFVQTGNYFWSGPSLAEVSGVWTCVPYPEEDCEPVRETLLVAIANDADIRNWLPLSVSVME